MIKSLSKKLLEKAEKEAKSPLERLLIRFAGEEARTGRPSGLEFGRCLCNNCKEERVFETPLFVDGVVKAALPMAKIGMIELPLAQDDGRTWSHFGQLNLALSERAQGPIYAFESRCPKEHCSGRSSVLRELMEAEQQALAEQKSQAKLRAMRLDRCDLCGTTRAGVDIKAKAGFAGGKPMASIWLYEIDMLRDFAKPGGMPPQRWCFRGVLDLSRSMEKPEYRWAATCPECTQKQSPTLSRAFIVEAPPPTPGIQ